MVILFNKSLPEQKTYNRVKHRSKKFSRPVNVKQITSANKQFLKSLGFKILI